MDKLMSLFLQRMDFGAAATCLFLYSLYYAFFIFSRYENGKEARKYSLIAPTLIMTSMFITNAPLEGGEDITFYFFNVIVAIMLHVIYVTYICDSKFILTHTRVLIFLYYCVAGLEVWIAFLLTIIIGYLSEKLGPKFLAKY